MGCIGVDSNGTGGDAVFPATSKFFRFSTSALFFICSTSLILCKKVKITNRYEMSKET